MTILKMAFWGLVALALVIVGLANRGIVTLRVLPETLGDWLGVSQDVDLPLFLVILLGVALGLLIGFVWEWIREIPERAHAREMSRENDRLRRELARRERDSLSENDALAAVDLPVIPQR